MAYKVLCDRHIKSHPSNIFLPYSLFFSPRLLHASNAGFLVASWAYHTSTSESFHLLFYSDIHRGHFLSPSGLAHITF